MHNASRIYVCHTPYHLLIACLKELKREGPSKASVILMDSLSNSEQYGKRLRASNLFDNVHCLKHESCFSSWTNTSFYKSLLWLKLHPNAKETFSFVLDANDVFIFNDHRDMGAVLHHFKKRYHLLEDGCDCFKHFDQKNLPTANNPILRSLLKRTLNIPISMGDSHYCVDIELNSAEQLATKIDKPIVVSKKTELMSGLDDYALDVLRGVFPVPNLVVEGVTSALLLTSPPEAHGANWSESDQLAFYGNVVRRCPQDVVFIKPHPRDTGDYKNLGNRVTVIPAELPIETLDIFAVNKFDLGICYISTALAQLKCCKRKMYLETDGMSYPSRL